MNRARRRVHEYTAFLKVRENFSKGFLCRARFRNGIRPIGRFPIRHALRSVGGRREEKTVEFGISVSRENFRAFESGGSARYDVVEKYGRTSRIRFGPSGKKKFVRHVGHSFRLAPYRLFRSEKRRADNPYDGKSRMFRETFGQKGGMVVSSKQGSRNRGRRICHERVLRNGIRARSGESFQSGVEFFHHRTFRAVFEQFQVVGERLGIRVRRPCAYERETRNLFPVIARKIAERFLVRRFENSKYVADV